MTDSDSPLYSVRMRSFLDERHLAGGEDIVPENSLPDRVREFVKRGLSPAPSDRPPSITIRIDPVDTKDLAFVPLLPVCCLETHTVSDTWRFLEDAFTLLETEDRPFDRQSVFDRCRALLSGERPVSPGAFLLSPSGRILNPEGKGIRVTHFGIAPEIREAMTEKSALHGTGNGQRFIEALQIASKALFHPLLRFELCLSDNPGYTTGYLALKETGYVRLPHAKPPGLSRGGRIYVLEREPAATELGELIRFLTRDPVLFTRESDVGPLLSPQSVLDRIGSRPYSHG